LFVDAKFRVCIFEKGRFFKRRSRNKILKTRLGAARGLLRGMKDAIATMDSILSESYRADTAGLLIAPWP
jgi:hypothetical protein